MRQVPVINHGKMSPERRELFLRCMDGRPDLVGVMHILNKYKYCDDFLKWMIKNKYTGNNLADWIRYRWKANVPLMVDYMVAQLNLTSAR